MRPGGADHPGREAGTRNDPWHTPWPGSTVSSSAGCTTTTMTADRRQPYLRYLAKRGGADMHPGGDAATVALLEALALEPGHAVLEVGCGTGRTITRLAAAGRGMAVTGLDLSPPILHLAKRRLRSCGLEGRAGLVVGRAERPPLADRRFDRVFCESVIGFLRGSVIEGVLTEIHRMLRPGGLVVANELIWKDDATPAAVRELAERCRRDFGLAPSTPDGWRRSDWRRVVTAHGFDPSSDALLTEATSRVGAERDDLPEPAASRRFTRRLARRSRLDLLALLEGLRYRRRATAVRTGTELLEARLFVWRRGDTGGPERGGRRGLDAGGS